MEGVMLAEDGGGVGEKSGESGRSGKRALERVVVENSETAVAASVGEGDKSGEEVETRSGGEEEEEEVGSVPEPEKTSGGEEEGGKDG